MAFLYVIHVYICWSFRITYVVHVIQITQKTLVHLMPTLCPTVQSPMPHSLSLALSTWILVARLLLRKKGKVSLMMKRNTGSAEIEKLLHISKQLWRLSTCGWRYAFRRQQGQLKLKSAYTVNFSCVWLCKLEMLFVDSKLPCNVCTHSHPEIVSQSSSS